MYISLLDYLEEIKKKFYIIIIFVVFFVGLSYSFQLYKNKVFSLNVRANLLKLSTLQLKGNTVEINPIAAIEWIGTQAEKIYKKSNNNNFPAPQCEREDHFLVCFAQGRFSGDINEVQKLMFNSVNAAFLKYEEYYIGIIDRLIIMNQELHEYVVTAEDTTIDSKASYKVRLENVKFGKQIFITALNDSKIDLKDVEIQKYQSPINYFLVILSSLVCGFFVIFLQMKAKP